MHDYKVAVQTGLICNIANLYYTLLMLDRQNEIVTNMSDLTKNTWDMMQLQMDFGRARSTSVQSAQAAYFGVQTQATDIKRQIREVENSLSLLMGELPTASHEAHWTDKAFRATCRVESALKC